MAEDAHANLQRIKQRMAEREKRTAIPLLSPKEFSAAIEANHDDAVALLDQRAERYLEAATQSWLPLAYGASDSDQVTPAEASRALEHLAEILQSRHDDNWLSASCKAHPAQPRKKPSTARSQATRRFTPDVTAWPRNSPKNPCRISGFQRIKQGCCAPVLH